jgi:hypothetical protein
MRSYTDRLQLVAAAADQQSHALTVASLAGIPWQPRAGARKLPPPFELMPENRPAAPGDAWKRFDRKLAALGRALEGPSILAAANAFAEFSTALNDVIAALVPPSQGSPAAPS